MATTQSDTRNEDKQSHKTTVREFLREHEEVASKDAIRAGTDVPAWYIDQIASTDEFYISINHNGAYVASKYIIGARGRHDCLWQPEVDDGIAVFHREESTKAALKELAFRRPSGLTAAEANALFDRRCYRPRRQLAEDGEVSAADHHGTTVYAHSWPSRRDDQLPQRQTDQPPEFEFDNSETDDFLYRDQLLATFLSIAAPEFQSILPERAVALVLRQFEGDSFDTLERRVQRNHSLREALDYSTPEDVPNGTSLWRAFDAVDPDELRGWLKSMCDELLKEHDHAGEFIVIDGTHIAA